MKKNTVWVIRALVAEGPTMMAWEDFKVFKDARTADDWICDYCRKTGCHITDFNLVRRDL